MYCVYKIKQKWDNFKKAYFLHKKSIFYVHEYCTYAND